MRCSWCEPLLDGFLENALPPRRMREVAAHVRRCRSCEALLAELRVIDALLTTASPPAAVGSDFTAAVVSATAQAHQPQRRRPPLWIFLSLYLALGWITIGILALQGNIAGTVLSAGIASTTRSVSEIGAVVAALSPGTPVLAALVSTVLLIDVALVALLLFLARRRTQT